MEADSGPVADAALALEAAIGRQHAFGIRNHAALSEDCMAARGVSARARATSPAAYTALGAATSVRGPSTKLFYASLAPVSVIPG